MSDWDAVEAAAKRLEWTRRRRTGKLWIPEAEWSSVQRRIAAAMPEFYEIWWCGPCPLTGTGGSDIHHSCRTRRQKGARDGVEMHCVPCQNQAGVQKLDHVPGQGYPRHKAALLVCRPGET